MGEDDGGKSKNILAWAGRVKELIGTYAPGRDPNMGQLTRATGYSDLLAACGVDSGDVNSKGTDQMSPTVKPMTYNQPKATPASLMVKQLVAEKETAGYSTAADYEDSRSPRSSTSVTLGTVDERRQEIRRASSSQDRGRLNDPAQKLPARRASLQTEAKPAETSDTSRSIDTRSPYRRGSFGDKQNSTNERTSGSGSRAPSSDSGGQQQPRKRPVARSSKETSLKQRDEKEMQKSPRKTTRDDSRGSPTRRRYDHDADRSTPRADPEERPISCAGRQRTSEPADDVDSVDCDEVEYQRGRAADRDWRPQEARVSRSYTADEESIDDVDLPTRRTIDRDRERYQQDRREPGPTESERKESSESLSERLSDPDMRRRAEYPSPERDIPPSQRRPGGSRPTREEPTNSKGLRSRGKDGDNYRRVPIGRRPVDMEDKDSVESLSERGSDRDLRQRAEYSSQERKEPQRLPGKSRPAREEPTNSKGLRSRGRDEREPKEPTEEKDSLESAHEELTGSKGLKSRGRDVGNNRRAPRVQPAVDSEEKDSLESVSERTSDPDMRRKAELSPPQRDQPPSLRVPGRSRSTNAETGSRTRGRDVENVQRVPKVPRPVDMEDKESVESLSEKVTDLDMPEKTSTVLQRIHSPLRLVAGRSPGTDSGHQDLTDRLSKQVQSVKGRRSLSSESSIKKPRPKQEHGDGATSTLLGRAATKPKTAPDRPPSPRPILRKSSPLPSAKDSKTAAAKGKRESPDRRARRPSASPAVRAKPTAVKAPPRRPTTAAAADIRDDDDYDDDVNDALLVARGRGRGLGKCSAVTDLFDRLDVSLPTTYNAPRQLSHGHTRTPIKSPTSPIAVPSKYSSQMTPRTIWGFIRPWLLSLHRLITFLMGLARHWLYEQFRKPHVVEAGHNLRSNWMKVMDDWALFTAVVFVLVLLFLVILLC